MHTAPVVGGLSQSALGCEETCILFSPPPEFTCGACSDGSGGAYNIEIDFGSNVPMADRGLVAVPKQRWEAIVTADIPDVDASTLSTTGSIGGCLYPDVIDDLHVCVFYDDLASDGPQGTLAYAFIEHLREDESQLPIAGVIGFDPVDVEALIRRDEMELAILHEMAHLLGLGTMWALLGVTGSVRDRCPYLGEHANAAYELISGCPTVPTELDGRPNDGTYCSHFDQWCLQNELMTGLLDDDTVISAVSIASLQDIGYSVDHSQAEPFERGDLGIGCACNRRGLENDNSIRTRPKLASAEAISRGTKFGQQLLQRNRAATSRTASNTYVADQMVMVLVQDGDQIVNIAVRSESDR